MRHVAYRTDRNVLMHVGHCFSHGSLRQRRNLLAPTLRSPHHLHSLDTPDATLVSYRFARDQSGSDRRTNIFPSQRGQLRVFVSSATLHTVLNPNIAPPFAVFVAIPVAVCHRRSPPYAYWPRPRCYEVAGGPDTSSRYTYNSALSP